MNTKYGKIKFQFFLERFLIQLLFNSLPKLVLNPVRFWYLYKTELLERCWEQDYVQFLERCWNQDFELEAQLYKRRAQ
jgi:lipid-A-disaccharide synthase-like uncharacterized protein